MSDKVETVKIGQLRYMVAVLRDEDIERVAKRMAFYMQHAQEDIVKEDLRLEHARQTPYEYIVKAAAEIERNHE